MRRLLIVYNPRSTRFVDVEKEVLSKARDLKGYMVGKYEVEIKRVRNKRSLTANAYYWVLVEKIAKALGSSKQEVHEEGNQTNRHM